MSDPSADAAARLAARLAAEDMSASGWSNRPGDRYAAHAHGYDKVLVVAAGSITFILPRRDESYPMEVGDRLELPAGQEHAALVGPDGVTCLEAHLPRGSLGAEPVLRRGWAAAQETAGRDEA